MVKYFHDQTLNLLDIAQYKLKNTHNNKQSSLRIFHAEVHKAVGSSNDGSAVFDGTNR